MPATMEGIISKTEKGKYGNLYLCIQGEQGFFNESADYQEQTWPKLSAGDKVKFTYATSAKGGFYVKGEDIEVLEATAMTDRIESTIARNGASSREDSIDWNVALKGAIDALTADGTTPQPNEVLTYAEILFDGRPSAPPQAAEEEEVQRKPVEEGRSYDESDMP